LQSGNKTQWLTLVWLLIKRDLTIRYRGSVLGYLWSMLNPLLTMAVMTMVFSYAMRVQMEHYPIYILSGLLCWNMFAQSTNQGVNAIVSNASLLKKVNVPSWVFPTAVIGSAMVHSCFAFVPYGIIALVTGFKFRLGLIQLPFVLIFFFIFIEGIVLTLSALNVFFRDVAHVLEPVLQLGFYGSPVLYSIESLPERFRFVVNLNPITHFLDGFRSALYMSPLLTPVDWAQMLLIASISIAVGAAIFGKSRHRFLYYI